MNTAEIFGIFKKAAKLTKDPNNGCCIVSATRHFALPPRYLGRLKKGAMGVLESEIGRYSESLHAVPLAFSNLQLIQQTGNILDDQPHIHFDVTFKAVVFKPALGSVLKCVVNEFAGDHVSCLVHNWFNLSLPLSGPDAERRLPRGSKVMARVTGIRGKNGILAIRATPMDDSLADLQHTEESVETKTEEAEDASSSGVGVQQKQKHDSGCFSDPDDIIRQVYESLSSDNDPETEKKKKKEKKKQREKDREYVSPGVAVKLEEESSKDINERTSGLSLSTSINSIGNGVCEIGGGVCSPVSSDSAKRKKKKKKDKRDSGHQETDFAFVKEELIDAEESPQVGTSSGTGKSKHRRESESQLRAVIKQEPVDVDEEESQMVMMPESEGRKKKKKKKRHESDQELPGESVHIKEEAIEPASSSTNVKEGVVESADATPNGGSQREKKKKKRRRKDGSGDEIEPRKIKTESGLFNSPSGTQDDDSCRGDGKNSGVTDMTRVKREPMDYEPNQLDGHRNKKNKRKAEYSFDEHLYRTTGEEVCGTVEQCHSVPPKKKKKHKKERESI